MEYKKILGQGTSGIVYLLRDKTCVKVYPFNLTCREQLMRYFQTGVALADAGVNVPRPLEILDVNLTAGDWPLATLMERLLFEERVNGNFLGIRREYVEGKPLGRRLFPSKSISDKIVELRHSIRMAGFEPNDVSLQNCIQTKHGEVYVIDIDNIAKPYRVFRPEKERRVPTCMLGELLDASSVSAF